MQFTPKTNCESFIMGCPVGFGEIFSQNQVFTTLEENQIVRQPFYLSACSYDATRYVQWKTENKNSSIGCLSAYV